MLLIQNESTAPDWNLALDEYMLTHFTEDVLSLWRNGPSVIIGKNQNAVEEIDQDFIRTHSIPVIRRLTGGGAVFHDLGNVNFTLVQPCGAGDFMNYGKFTQPIIAFLSTLGVEAFLSGRNDLLIEGLKCSGNAQTVQGGRILHHGTLLFSTSMSDLSGALRPNAAKIQSKGIKSVVSRVTNIASHLPHPMEIEEFLSALYQYLLTNTPGVTQYTLTDEDRAKVEELRVTRYSTWDWNFGRSPAYTWARAAKFDFGLVDVRLSVVSGKIAELSIYGDYFGQKDVAELEQALRGKPYRWAELTTSLESLPVGDYISGIQPAQLLDLLCD